MFAVDCPYCQHANKPGARFCADCGAPLHLKPCPKCGKVDDVTVRQCSGCGAAFPTIKLAAPGGEPAPSSAPEPVVASPRPVIVPPSSSYRPGPLIAVALVAGGLPILWMNRDLLPQPRAWQAETPKAANVAAPAATTSIAEPVMLRPSVVVPAVAAQSAAVTAEAHSVPATQGDAPRVVPADETTVPPAETTSKSKRSRDASGTEKKRARQTDSSVKAPSVSPSTPVSPPSTRQCTESLVALGLCDRSQIEK